MTLEVDVSFVVIAYNESAHAADCVRSILAQASDSRYEIVFVDDGSTDDTAEVAVAAAAGDKRLKTIRLDSNQGRGAARAAGVRAARGRAIGFVDADITLPPDWLERCLAELPGNAAVGGVPVPDGDVAVLAAITRAMPKEVPGGMPITGSNVLFDASVLRQTGFDPRDRLGEDFRLAARLQRAGHRLARVPGLTVKHEEVKPYSRALRWRFENGVDAASHPRELGMLRFPDVVWAGWLAAWIVALAGPFWGSPWLLLAGIAASVGVGVVHAATRFHTRPVLPFLLACLADIPLMNANMLGRIWGLPRLLFGRG